MACFLLFPFLRYRINVSLFLCVEFFNSQARLFCNNGGNEGENEGNFELVFMLASHPFLYTCATKKKSLPKARSEPKSRSQLAQKALQPEE